MTGVVTLHLHAENLDDAIQKATERWRKFMAKDDAELPWSSHFNAVEDLDDAPVSGDDKAKLHFTVVIEFDRTVADSAATH